MNIIARGALWGAAVSMPLGIAIGVWSCYLQGPDNPISLRASVTIWITLTAFTGTIIGAGISAMRFIFTRIKRGRVPAMQYDAPQEGVWPPPPITLADTTRGNS